MAKAPVSVTAAAEWLKGLKYALTAPVRVSATEDAGWVRLDTRDGAVVRRRRALLPLVF